MYRIGKKFFLGCIVLISFANFYCEFSYGFRLVIQQKNRALSDVSFFFHENGISVEGAFHRYMINKAKLPNNLWSKIQNM